MWVTSVNDKKGTVIKLFRMPKETIDIKNTQITTSHELFILCRAAQWSVQGVEIVYRLYSIDLDAVKEGFKGSAKIPGSPLELVFQFSSEDVQRVHQRENLETHRETRGKDLNFRDMHVRPSNRKKSSDKEVKLIVFLLFENTVLCYVHGLPEMRTGLSLRFVTRTSSTKFERSYGSDFYVRNLA